MSRIPHPLELDRWLDQRAGPGVALAPRPYISISASSRASACCPASGWAWASRSIRAAYSLLACRSACCAAMRCAAWSARASSSSSRAVRLLLGCAARAHLRAGLRGRPGIRLGYGWRVRLGCALWRPGFPGVDGGLVLAGDGAFDGLEICFELRHHPAIVCGSSAAAPAVPPLAGRVRGVGVRLWLWRLLALMSRVPAAQVLIRALPASSRCRSAASCRGEGLALAAPVWSCCACGVGGLLQGVGFGLRGEPQAGR